MRILLTTLLIFVSHFNIFSQSQKFFPSEALMPIGAYYYPEHWDRSQWDRDLKKIADLGFEFTHFGEFAWAQMEPEEGKFDFEWLDYCVEKAAQYGLKVIMCTPTPTPPVWLTQKHPEILTVNQDGFTQHHGSRLHASYNHRVYLDYVEKIVNELTARYGNDDRIWGWQIDNEPHYGTLYDYSAYAEQEFGDWLREKYSTIDSLNHAWGAAFWSQTYNHFDQVQIPNPNRAPQGVNPHQQLDFQRFTADQLAEAIRFQADLLEANISEKQWITTNYAYYKFLPPVDLFRNQEDLDFASHTMYLLSTFLNYPQGELAHRLGSGMELSFSNELAKSVNGFTGIMELQPGQINWGKWNSQPLPGAVRMWIWHSFGLGDKFTCTYRFRQPIYGSEQFHKGIMETDGTTLARGGAEYVQALEEIKSLRTRKLKNPRVPQAVQSRKTAFLWNQENLLDIANYPHNESWDPWQHYYTYYENLKTLGAPVTFLQETDEFDPEEFPFMIAPSYQLITTELVAKWRRYVEQGGHLVLTSRTGLKDKNGHLWEALLQEPIWDLIGAKVEFYDHLPPGTEGTVEFNDQEYQWNIWGDILEPNSDQTEVLSAYTSEFYQGSPAVIRRKLGQGTVTYIGVWTGDRELERMVLRNTFQQGGAEIIELPRYVFTEWRDGFWVTVNYSSYPVDVPLPERAEILFGKKTVPPAGVLVWQEK